MEKARVINQCNELYEQGKQILSESGWMIWLGNTDGYFEKLRNYARHHNQFKNYLTGHFKEDQLILDRITKLPDIHFNDFAFSRFLTSVLFPLSFLFEVRAIKYVNNTRSKIGEANTIYGTLSTLLNEIN